MSNLSLAARLLWASVPEPARKPAKPQKSWKTLEPGRELRLLTRWFDGLDWWEPGTVFVVSKPTNQGVMLTKPHCYDWSRQWSRDWKGVFEKVRKTGKKKRK